MTNKKYFFYIVLTIPCDMIKKFILKTFIVRKIHNERKLALFLKKSDIPKFMEIESLVPRGKVFKAFQNIWEAIWSSNQHSHFLVP